MTEPGSINKPFHNRQNPEPPKPGEEETRRLLAIIQSRYDMRASEAGRFLHDVDCLAAKVIEQNGAKEPTLTAETDGWTTIYFSFPRKGYWPPAIEAHGLDAWEQTHRERFNYIECEIWRKRTSDLTPEDMDIAAQYGDIPEEWAHPDRVDPPSK